jgi:signal transduction histidine kinase/ActR/RegA family two-component response regulator
MASVRCDDALDDAAALRARLADAEEMLRAIRHGELDALVVRGSAGDQIFTLHNTDEPYRTLVEEMHEGAVVLSSRGDVLYSNARFAALVGRPLKTVIGGRIERFLKASERADFDRLLRSGSGQCISRLLGSGSGTLDVRLSLTTTSSPSGEQLNLIVTDLTEILEANSNRARAEHDSRTKDDFLTMLAHELRSPLGAIANAVAVLELTHAEGQAAAHAHEVIGRQLGLVSRLIDDLLDIERILSGKLRLQRQPLDIAETAREVVAIFAGKPELDRQLEIGTEPVWVEGDAARLMQVLTNLVGNAVKYTPPGSRIRVEVRAEDGDAVISVADEGFGISPTLLPLLFDLYMQADRTILQSRGGLGVGLSLVRRLVELHGGSVEALSDGVGRGSTFVVRLKQVPSMAAAASASIPPEPRSRSRRVLVIEDSTDARETLRMALQHAGHEVYDAADGLRGLELVNAVRPDVAIIGIGLQLMDGYEVARRIRARPDGRAVLLLALTGNSDAAPDSHAHGFDHHLVKPVDVHHLARLVNEGAEAAVLCVLSRVESV